MAKIISTLFISLDGVVEPDENWHFPYFDEAMGAAVRDDYDTADTLLLGRVTYDSFVGAWPDREAAGGEDAAFAKTLGDMRKLVASRHPHDLGWRNVELIDGDLDERNCPLTFFLVMFEQPRLRLVGFLVARLVRW